MERVRKGVTPREIVYEEDQLKVYHYIGEGEPRFKTPLCFVFALVNRPYIMDLKEGRSIVANYVKAGFDTYLIDWGTPTRAERFLTTDDYVNGYLLNVVEHLRERHGSDQVNLLGYCMGGTLSTMFTAIHQDLVKNLVLLATGIDFSTREGLINLWTDPRYFDVDKFVDTMGNIPAEFLQTAFLMLKPIANLVEKPINLMENIHRDEFVDDYLHMETWLNDNIPVPGEVYREFAKYLFQQNLLTKNRMPLGRHIVDLRKITCPLLNLMARNDDLVPCAQSEVLTTWSVPPTRKRSSGQPGTLDSPSAAGPKKSCGREPLTGSSSAPIDTPRFHPDLPRETGIDQGGCAAFVFALQLVWLCIEKNRTRAGFRT